MKTLIKTLEDHQEEKILNLKLEDIFQMLHSKANDHASGMCSMSFQYLNVCFEISCEIKDTVIVPRGYEDVQE